MVTLDVLGLLGRAAILLASLPFGHNCSPHDEFDITCTSTTLSALCAETHITASQLANPSLPGKIAYPDDLAVVVACLKPFPRPKFGLYKI